MSSLYEIVHDALSRALPKEAWVVAADNLATKPDPILDIAVRGIRERHVAHAVGVAGPWRILLRYRVDDIADGRDCVGVQVTVFDTRWRPDAIRPTVNDLWYAEALTASSTAIPGHFERTCRKALLAAHAPLNPRWGR